MINNSIEHVEYAPTASAICLLCKDPAVPLIWFIRTQVHGRDVKASCDNERKFVGFLATRLTMLRLPRGQVSR